MGSWPRTVDGPSEALPTLQSLLEEHELLLPMAMGLAADDDVVSATTASVRHTDFVEAVEGLIVSVV
jgi:hypothetical protein